MSSVVQYRLSSSLLVVVEGLATTMRNSRLQMNPAFARAHGLSAGGDPMAAGNVGSTRVEAAIRDARNSGQLRLNNAGIGLPNEIFELSSSLQVNLSMDSQQSAYQHTEDTLTVVDLSDNKMISGELDDRFTKFIRVQQLRFKRCQWSKMTVSLASLTFLRILDFSGNQLTTFDMNLLPPCLYELNLSGNQLDIVTSSGTSNIIELQVLDLSHNKLRNLNGCHISCPALRLFLCHHNSFSTLPTALLDTSMNLEFVDASYNMIDSVLDLSCHASLKKLNLGMNRLTTIPTIPDALLTLDVTENRIKDVKELLAGSGTSPAALIELMLSGNHLSEIDGSVFEKYSNLQRLDISSNKLTSLPYQLGFLNLRAFRVASNPLFTFKRSDVEKNPTAILAVLRKRAPKRDDTSSKPSTSSSIFIPALRGTAAVAAPVSTIVPAGSVSPLLSRRRQSSMIEFLVFQLKLHSQ